MQTFSFTMGVLSVVSLGVLGSFIAAWIRIIRLEKSNRRLADSIQETDRLLNMRTDDLYDYIKKESRGHHRDLTMVEHTLRNQISAIESKLRETENRLEESQMMHSDHLDRKLTELNNRVSSDLKGQVWEWINEQNECN